MRLPDLSGTQLPREPARLVPAWLRSATPPDAAAARRAAALRSPAPAFAPSSPRRPTSPGPGLPRQPAAGQVRHPAAARARPPGAALAAPRRRHRAGPPAGHAAGADRGAGPAALARSVRPGAPLGALAAETLLPPPFGDRRDRKSVV